MEGLLAERATREYHSFLAAAPQLLSQLCTDRMGGQDTGTGLLTPVLQRPSSIQGCKRGKSIIPGGNRFPFNRNSGPVAKTVGYVL